MLDQSVEAVSVNISKVQSVKCKHVVGSPVAVGGSDRMIPSASGYKTRLFYNSNVKPPDIEAILANKGKKHKKLIDKRVVKSMVFTRGHSAMPEVVIPPEEKCNPENDCTNTQNTAFDLTNTSSIPNCDNDSGNSRLATGGGGESQVHMASFRVTENMASSPPANQAPPKITNKSDYDENHSGIEDKFISSILNESTKKNNAPTDHQSALFRKWQAQSDFPFGYIPIDDQVMPNTNVVHCLDGFSPFTAHALVKATGKPNYMEARLPVPSQLNVDTWKSLLTDYWDQQLLQLLEFGFPLDFNRNCPLRCDNKNHSSAIQYPNDVEAYIKEETEHQAILGPFSKNPIPGGHQSPFMTRSKPNSDRRRVIVDFSWPIGESVNAGIDKNTYLGSQFDLNFPSIDHITEEAKRIGRGALLYKVDVSRVFRHVKVDPGDYDLLGLEWYGAYIDMCLPFGTRHGSQIFQRMSDAVRYMMRQKGFPVIDYIDDYVGVGVPSVAHASYHFLLDLMERLGLSVSQKKLVSPSTRVTCLGVLIDTDAGTISIPPEKLTQINETVHQWLEKRSCTRRQLQSLLGLLLYIHKCVKPARIFLNRMLELLRAAHGSNFISLTSEF